MGNFKILSESFIGTKSDFTLRTIGYQNLEKQGLWYAGKFWSFVEAKGFLNVVLLINKILVHEIDSRILTSKV